MKRALQVAKANVLYYKLAYFYGFLYSMNALATAIVASFMNTEWSDLSSTSKFLLIVVIFSNWTGTMLAFMNKTLSRLQNEQPLIESGDTVTINKQDVTPPSPPKVG